MCKSPKSTNVLLIHKSEKSEKSVDGMVYGVQPRSSRVLQLYNVAWVKVLSYC